MRGHSATFRIECLYLKIKILVISTGEAKCKEKVQGKAWLLTSTIRDHKPNNIGSLPTLENVILTVFNG